MYLYSPDLSQISSKNSFEFFFLQILVTWLLLQNENSLFSHRFETEGF